ncbi:MAG: hypothetical protein ACPGU5_08355 [Lishizhenia sp.]
MKNKLVVLICLLSFSNFAKTIKVDDSKRIGFIAFLTELKISAESKIMECERDFAKRNLSNSAPNKNDLAIKDSVYKTYGLLKLKTDILINQLSADLILKNSTCLYRKMDKYFVDNSTSKRITKYLALIEEIKVGLKNLLEIKFVTSNINPLGVETLTALFSLVGFTPYSLLKEYKESKEKKISTVVGYIKLLSLNSISDLIKKEEEG